MSKKLSKKVDYFEDYHIIALVSHLKDYTLCHHINSGLRLDLIKYDDLVLAIPTTEENSFSWYFYQDKESRTFYYLIGNKGENGILMSSQKTVDYFLLIKNPVSEQFLKSITGKIRKIPNITAVFDFNMRQFKDMDLLLETNELHELEYVRRGMKKDSL